MFRNAPTTLIIYHGDCPDGALAAALLHRALLARGQRAASIEAIGCMPAVTPPRALHAGFREVYFVDTCPTLSDWNQLVNAGKHVQIYDHHLTAAAPGAVVDHSECAASLVAREYGLPDSNLVRYVKDFDLYRNELPHTFDVRMMLGRHLHFMADVELFEKWFDRDFAGICHAGQILRVAHEQVVEDLADRARPSALGPHPAWFADCPSRATCSDVANLLALRHGVVGIARRTIAGGASYSLRSVVGVGVDVSAIAAEFGGGGHRHAAGFFVADKKVS